MDHLVNLVRHEAADSALAFRSQAYRNSEIGVLLRDLVALANATTTDDRLLLLGVDDSDGERRFPGISAGTIKKLGDVLPALIDRAIEPAFDVTVSAVHVNDKLVAAIRLYGCDDPPYLLRHNISASMSAGAGWIRRGTCIGPLLRADIDEMFNRRLSNVNVATEPPTHDESDVASPQTDTSPAPNVPIRLGFPGTPLQQDIELEVLPLTDLPSAVAAGRIKKLLEAREHTRAVLGKTETHIQRLMHAKMHDPDSAYEEEGDDTLLGRLSRVKNDNHHADAHYEYELRTHCLQLTVENGGDEALIDAALELKIPLIDGIGVSDTLYTESGEPSPLAYAYPEITTEPHAIGIHCIVPHIAGGGSTPVFTEPPRLWIREAAAGRTAEVHYRLWSESLGEAVSGSLRIHVPYAWAELRATVDKHSGLVGRSIRRIDDR